MSVVEYRSPGLCISLQQTDIGLRRPVSMYVHSERLSYRCRRLLLHLINIPGEQGGGLDLAKGAPCSL